MVDRKREIQGPVESQPTPAELLERIHHFEHIYETASKHMAKAVSVGVVRETAEIGEWMQVYRKLLSVDGDYKGEKVIKHPPEPAEPAPAPERPAGNERRRSNGKIPVRKISAQQAYNERAASVRDFERRYEMSSADMLELLSNDLVRETGDILKWMFDYRVLQGLEREGIPTTGTPGTTT